MAKMKGIKNSVEKVLKWEEIQQGIFNKLRKLELPPFASREMAARLQKLGVLPTDQFYNLEEDLGRDDVIFVESVNAKYIIRRPILVDFFGAAKLEVLD